jgi:transcription elongation factor Elf1
MPSGTGLGIFADSFILDLSAAVDVYSDWVDACDTVAKEAAGRDYEHGTLDPGGKNSDTQID